MVLIGVNAENSILHGDLFRRGREGRGKDEHEACQTATALSPGKSPESFNGQSDAERHT